MNKIERESEHPSDIIFLNEFPIGHTGKVLKSRIRSIYTDQLEMAKG